MKRIPSLILTAILALYAAPTLAAPMTAWTLIDDSSPGKRSVTASCAAGTSCDDPTGSTATGVDLRGIQYVTIEVCADEGRTISDGNGIAIWLLDSGGQWGVLAIYPVLTGKRCAWVAGDSPMLGAIPVPPRGWLQAIPAAMATDQASALTVRIRAVDRSGNRL